MPENIIQIDQHMLETRLDRLVTQKVTEILNAMLDAEADEIAGASRYERSGGWKAYRADHYERRITAKAGTLELKEDSHGLWGKITINRDDADAMNLYARVQRGDVDQCSFGFDIERETFIDLGDGRCRWEIEKVNPLFEVSVCMFPAYEGTSVSARRQQLETIKQREAQAWRESMKSRLEATKHGT